jgi:hypothetical protein
MKKCILPECGRVDSDIGNCGSQVTCPNQGEPIRTDGKDILLKDRVTGTTRCLPIERIVSGRAVGLFGFENSLKENIVAFIPGEGSKKAKAPSKPAPTEAPAGETTEEARSAKSED